MYVSVCVRLSIHCSIVCWFSCLRLRFFSLSLLLLILLLLSSVMFYSCRPFIFSQTCLIIFTKDYFSFLFHKYAQNDCSSASAVTIFPNTHTHKYTRIIILLFSPSILWCCAFFFSLLLLCVLMLLCSYAFGFLLILQYVSYVSACVCVRERLCVRTFRHKYTIFSKCCIFYHNAVWFD